MAKLPVPLALAQALLWLLGRLPLSWLQAAGAALGRWWWRSGRREARVAQANLELCLPHLGPDERAQLLRACLEHTGRTALELPWLWSRSRAALNRRIHVVEGEALFRAALAAPRGLIVAAPHLGAWEALNLYLSQARELAILYRPPRQRWVELALNRWRGRFGAEAVPAEAAGVRRLFKRLKDGGVVGILPDQQPKVGEGEFAPFFGLSAFTMTLLSKLATRSGATVLFAWAERLPRGAGYAIRFRDCGEIGDTGALNRAVEQLARSALAQYQWTYKRFSIRPDGVPERYPRH